jgi:hypothetical protein
VLVDGRPLEEYAARGRRYVEAIEGAEYEVRIHNPLPVRVGVALSVDGLNTINARHTTAWLSSKWVIAPYQTIQISGWQVSSERARHFYFTTERDSYGARLGQTANLGLISAVFFREQQAYPVTVVPPLRPLHPPYEEKGEAGRDSKEPSASTSPGKSSARAYPAPDDQSAATDWLLRVERRALGATDLIHIPLPRGPFGTSTMRGWSSGEFAAKRSPTGSDATAEDARGLRIDVFSPEPGARAIVA